MSSNPIQLFSKNIFFEKLDCPLLENDFYDNQLHRFAISLVARFAIFSGMIDGETMAP